MRDPKPVGVPYPGHYAVWTALSTIGIPGTFVHDARAVAVYEVLLVVRDRLRWVGGSREPW